MQLDAFAELGTCSGKTSPAHSAATQAETLLSWCLKWQGPASLSQKTAGETKAWRWVSMDSSSGPCLTRHGSEYRSGAVASSLSLTLETGPIDRRPEAGVHRLPVHRPARGGSLPMLELPGSAPHFLHVVAGSETKLLERQLE